MPKWYYLEFGDEVGPVTSNELRELAALRKIDAETFIRRDDSAEWVKATKIKGLILPMDYSLDEPVSPAAAYRPAPAASNSSDGETPGYIYTVLIVLDVLGLGLFFYIEPIIGFWMLFHMLTFGAICAVTASALKKKELALSLLLGMSFGIFGLIAVVFLPKEDGAR